MVAIYLLFHGNLEELKTALSDIIHEPSFSSLIWSKMVGGGGHILKLCGYHIIFLPKSHTLALTYGTSKTRNRPGLSKKDTEEHVKNIVLQLKEKNNKFNEVSCGEGCIIKFINRKNSTDLSQDRLPLPLRLLHHSPRYFFPLFLPF